MTSARIAIALLVQNPKLAERPELQAIDWNVLKFPGVELFRSIVDVITAQKPTNMAVLLESCRGSSDEKSVRSLGSLELLVAPENIETVFCDALAALVKQSMDAELERLLSQKLLTLEEKESLLKLLALKK
jgi:DNA primase